MKKNIVALFTVILIQAFCMNAGATVMAEAIPSVENSVFETKNETVQNKQSAKKELKKQKKERLEALKQKQKEQMEQLEKLQKQEKEDLKASNKQKIQDLKEAKKQAKINDKLAKAQKKESNKQAKILQKQQKKQEKQELKQAKVESKLQEQKQKQETKKENILAEQQAQKAQETQDRLKESKKIQKKDVEDIFGETSVVSHKTNVSSYKNYEQVDIAKKDEVIDDEKVDKVQDEPKNEHIAQTVHKKESKNEIIDIDEAEKELEKTLEDKNLKPVSDVETTPALNPQNGKQSGSYLHKKNYTYEEIDKNAVSINDFLNFTDKQNEKFSIFYYKTTSKLSVYKKAVNLKEDEIKKAETSSELSVEEKLTKIKKLKKEIDNIYYERDKFYNDSLDKFNSILNKKQQTKWEILQEMGYRFLPEID